MSGGANIVELYAGADVPARIELLIKYYPNFIRLVEYYLACAILKLQKTVLIDCERFEKFLDSFRNIS